MMYTVAKPAIINVIVATTERTEKRLIPQTPWPLVQPLPSRVPKPTRRPARISAPVEREMLTVKTCGEKRRKRSPPVKRPTTNSTRHTVSSCVGLKSPHTIPLTPAILPLHSKRSDALRPMSIPPQSEASGVKFSTELTPLYCDHCKPRWTHTPNKTWDKLRGHDRRGHRRSVIPALARIRFFINSSA